MKQFKVVMNSGDVEIIDVDNKAKIWTADRQFHIGVDENDPKLRSFGQFTVACIAPVPKLVVKTKKKAAKK